MEFGVYLNQYGDPRHDTTYDELATQASLLEELGYDTAAVGERHFYDDGFLDPLTLVTSLATETDSIDLMTNVLLLPIYHPVHLAERIANVDILSNGRTRWGVSLGYRESELTNFGVAMEERVPRFMESIHLLKRLLAGERVDHDGDHFHLDDAFVEPQPVQDPRPRFWGGGRAPVAIKRAAFRCDGFSAAGTVPAELERDVGIYYDALEERGKDPDDGTVTIMVDGYVAETEDAAYDAVDPYLLDVYEMYARWGNPGYERPTWDDIEEQILVGSVEQVAAKLETYRDIGVDHVIFRTQFPGMDQETALDSIRTFGADVLPAVR